LLEGLKRLEFDAMAEFWIPDISCFQKARDDPYYGQVVKPDEDQLFEWETAMWQFAGKRCITRMEKLWICRWGIQKCRKHRLVLSTNMMYLR
jgi:hypothetical protein